MRKGFLGLGILASIGVLLALGIGVILFGGLGFTLFKGDIFNLVALGACLIIAWALAASAATAYNTGESSLFPLVMVFAAIGVAVLGISFVKPDLFQGIGLSVIEEISAPAEGEANPNAGLILAGGAILLLYLANNKKWKQKLPRWIKK